MSGYKYSVKSSYGGLAVFSDLAKAKAYAYLICAEAPGKYDDGVADTFDGDKKVYTVKRNKTTITAESGSTKKKLSMIVPDKYRNAARSMPWPMEYYYAGGDKKPEKMCGAQYRDLTIYYVAKDIRNGKYKFGTIYKGARKTKYMTVEPINSSTFEIKTRQNSGKYTSRICTWAEISGWVKGL